ncbi:MAG: PDZ domain-containing protein [Saprospiraceae bacterium]|nr:PDZ domain-containing protein [Saprospiraceae bacterium]
MQTNSQTTKIPFRYVQSFIIIEVKLEGVIPLRLLFDTGAEHNLLFDRSATDLIKDVYLRDIKVLGSDLIQEIPAMLTDYMGISLENTLERKVQFIVLKEFNQHLSSVIGERIDGILSAKIFANKVFEIDYKKHRIIVYDNKPAHKKLSHYQECKINIYKNKPYVFSDLSLSNSDSVYNLNFLLDTGAGLALLIYKNEQTTLQIPEKGLPGKLGSGLGGVVEGYITRSKYLSFCKTRYDDVVSNFQEVSTIYSDKESRFKQGLIGNQILDHYSIIFDYSQEKMYLKRDKKIDNFRYDRSGLSLICSGVNFDQFYIAHIIPGSPADQSRILIGDQLLSVNRIPCSFLTLHGIQTMLCKESGKKIRLKLLRNGKRIVREVYLQNLL